jgi:hypothetical protein
MMGGSRAFVSSLQQHLGASCWNVHTFIRSLELLALGEWNPLHAAGSTCINGASHVNYILAKAIC